MYDIARLRIGLADMPRPVLRRIEVRLSTQLDDLHSIIQAAMGWENLHPYRFSVGGPVAYGEIDPARPVEGLRSSAKATLADLCRGMGKNRTFEYVYDFEDRWIHRVKLLAVGDSDPSFAYPRLLYVKRRCPPEDCGGPWGYARFLESVDAPQQGIAEMALPWDDEFNPDTVDEDALQLRVQEIARDLEEKRERARRRA